MEPVFIYFDESKFDDWKKFVLKFSKKNEIENSKNSKISKIIRNMQNNNI